MRDHSARASKSGWKRASSSILMLLLCAALHAQEACPVEIKLLLSPASVKSAISSLDFGKETAGRIYFFDTDNLNLLAQGVIVRLRQGAKNDLTVKVRLPEGNKRVDTSRLRANFACEIDRTEAGANISYSVGQKYKDGRVPDGGGDLFSVLSPQQRDLLNEAHVSINWSSVKRITSIRSTTWETSSDSQFRKLTLEYWEFPAGSLLELSTKSAADEWESQDAELHRIVKLKGLALSVNQQTKTTTVLRGSKHDLDTPK
jgi:CYTH domain